MSHSPEDAFVAWSSLTAAPAPVGLYEPFTRFGDLVALSAISSAKDGALVTGKVGRDLDLEEGREAARRAADNLLAVLVAAAGGDPAGIDRLLLVRGYVNAAEDFAQVHKVIDAASERLIATLGEGSGRHARSALGCATLPNNNAVTLEAIAVLRPDPQP
jgi:enamine deaminase RidA (YjgF/YER057c/UK114 family)